jgi:hypothetical protein
MNLAAVLEQLAVGPGPGDFDAYFMVGRHMVEGVRSYDSTTVLAAQQALGRGEDYANLVWYSPHILPLFCVFGLLPFGFAWVVWLALQMGLVFASADRLWIFVGGKPAQRHRALLLTAAFYPVLALAVWRQASGLLLAGLVGFLLLERKGRPFAAGACLGLLAIKPQLAYLAWLGIFAWIVLERRWRVALGVVSVVAAGVLLALLINAEFTVAYVRHLVGRPPDLLISPALGSQLRRLVPSHPYALQFVPALLGIGWFAVTWKQRRTQGMARQLPALIASGFVFSVFYWTPDLVLHLVWVIPALAAVPDRRHALVTFVVPLLALSVVVLVLHEHLLDHNFYALSLAYALLLHRARLPEML